MKISHKIFIMILCVVVSSGTLYALNGTKSPKLPWQGIANASYDSVHNVGSSYLADARFTLMNSNTIVSDSITGLQWQSYKSTGSADYTANYAITSTWLNAKAYCAGLSLGGYNVGTWRLPTVKELGSIVDFSVTTSPSINTTYFWGQSTNYWTSTVYAPTTSVAWIVSLAGGYISNGAKTGSYYVRCVH